MINGQVYKYNTMEIGTDEYKEFMDKYAEDCRQYEIEQHKKKDEYRNKLKDFIPQIDLLFEYLNDNMTWEPEGIVEIYNTDETRSGYKNYQHIRIKDDVDNLLYMKQNTYEDEVGVDHDCVWQTTGYCGDDYSGYLLYPMNDGRYFKVSYSC